MNNDKTQSFWTSLPGVLTGLASLLTAIVAVVGIFGHHKKDETTSPAPSGVVKLRNLDHCKEFAGKWDWFIGGELRAQMDGSVDWRKDPSDPQPVIAGRWSCLDANPKQINISWPNGISETLAFSPDKKNLSGKNTIGVQVSGSKKR